MGLKRSELIRLKKAKNVFTSINRVRRRGLERGYSGKMIIRIPKTTTNENL